ncbi:SpoIID/LytB domain-containing protein [Chlamydia ibidis]|nr:SpoIID/LytB domain-containing protein [Chlamydia ibidis]
MLKHILLGFACSMSVVGYTEVKVSDTFIEQTVVCEPKVRVLLLNESTTALIESKGAYRVYVDNALVYTSAQGIRCAAHALYDGIRWGQNFSKAHCLKIEPVDSGALLFVNGIQYQGALYIHKTDRNCIIVTNELTVEDYLKSVLSIKYLRELDKEALSACVILERTALYERLLARSSQNFWHVTAEEDHYAGYGATKQFYGVEEAVEWTSRLIVDNPDGLIIDAEGLIKANVDRLAVEGYNARQILERFYKDADFVVIESWEEERSDLS